MMLIKQTFLLAISVMRASCCLNSTLGDTENINRYAEFVPDGESAVLACGYRWTNDSLVPQLSASATRNCTRLESDSLCARGQTEKGTLVHSATWFFQTGPGKLEPVGDIIPDAEMTDSNLVLRIPIVNASLYGVYTCAVYVRANASSIEADAAADGSEPCECHLMRKGLNLFGRVRGSEDLARDAIVRLIAALVSSGVFIALASGACLVYTFRYKPPKAAQVSDEMAPGEKNVAYELDAPPDEEPPETADCDGGEKPATEEQFNDKETAM